MTMIDRVFRDHPHSVGESYLQHMQFAAGFGFRLLAAATAALVHSVVPCIFETTASGMIRKMAQDLDTRRLTDRRF